ncbi:hypothetical protein BST63_35850 [Bradyrhizobium canariense]|uniref:Uncharacterized protein n=1 Tax=Bradyrhizobium canariense TaxID=255045 RepID=A0ABX3WSL9_9BRAD|nr:hypothetical protein BSR47_31540 [Bradyrhizobium canariense]OSJ21087.1 hypothetical protein BST63_35850 [Bradyrhizobium canariense]
MAYVLTVTSRIRWTLTATTPLLWVLRDMLQMTATRFGCGMALCGAYTRGRGDKSLHHSD